MEKLNWIGWVAAIASSLLAISETLPFISSIKANGIFQAIIQGLGFLKKLGSSDPK